MMRGLVRFDFVTIKYSLGLAKDGKEKGTCLRGTVFNYFKLIMSGFCERKIVHSGDINMHDDPRKCDQSIKSANIKLLYMYKHKN